MLTPLFEPDDEQGGDDDILNVELPNQAELDEVFNDNVFHYQKQLTALCARYEYSYEFTYNGPTFEDCSLLLYDNGNTYDLGSGYPEELYRNAVLTLMRLIKDTL